MSRSKRIALTEANIRRIVREERKNLMETLELGMRHPTEVHKQTKEVDAKDLAKSVTQCMNYYQLCKLKESKMVEDLKKLQEIKRELKRRILKGI
jgi:predicted ATPase